MNSRVLLVVFALSSVSLAEEAVVYETLDQIAVGRVFLNPEQRRELDRQRRTPPPTDAPQRTTDDSPTLVESGKNAFGFIILHDGTSSSWSDGEFRHTSERAARDGVQQSQRISITSHGYADGGREAVDGDADGLPQEAAKDEAEKADDQSK
jgi:hypothetical protein